MGTENSAQHLSLSSLLFPVPGTIGRCGTKSRVRRIQREVDAWTLRRNGFGEVTVEKAEQAGQPRSRAIRDFQRRKSKIEIRKEKKKQKKRKVNEATSTYPIWSRPGITTWPEF